MRKIIAIVICIILNFSVGSAFAQEEVYISELTRQEQSEYFKEKSLKALQKLREGEKNNEIFVHFMDTTFGESMAETLLKQMLPDFNFEQISLSGDIEEKYYPCTQKG